jgi:hypothetical protein
MKRSPFVGVNRTAIVPPMSSAICKPDRYGFMRVRILRLIPTSDPIVYTAKLACGHEKRLNMRGHTQRLQKTARCLICTDKWRSTT